MSSAACLIKTHEDFTTSILSLKQMSVKTTLQKLKHKNHHLSWKWISAYFHLIFWSSILRICMRFYIMKEKQWNLVNVLFMFPWLRDLVVPFILCMDISSILQ